MFNRKKFLEFPLERQHKKCSELLKQIYENLLRRKTVDDLFLHYQELQQWMQLDRDLSLDVKNISDRYHYHLKLAQQMHQEHHLLPAVRKGDREHGEKPWPIVIYLDSLRSAHNVGSIIRTVEAFALGTIYFSEQTPYIDNLQVQKTSMNAFQWVECKKNCFIDQLPKPLVVLETSAHAIPLHEFIFPESFTLAIGNEEYGCSDTLLQAADYMIEIPLRGRKNSLNVANAFAITASEIHRQKKESYV